MSEKTDTTELLPCPHCGGEAEVLSGDALVTGEERFSVYCENLSCRAGQYGWVTPQRAISAWNRRAPSSLGKA